MHKSTAIQLTCSIYLESEIPRHGSENGYDCGKWTYGTIDIKEDAQ